MIITKKIGNLESFTVGNRAIDRLYLQWYETSKRILHKKTESGKNIVIRALNESQNLRNDDVLFADDQCLIAVEIVECEAIVLQPKNMHEMAVVCYEIGNKHLPLFFQDNKLLIPYEAPVFTMLKAAGFEPEFENKKLLNQVKTTVSPHAHSESRESLFSKILKLNTPSAHE